MCLQLAKGSCANLLPQSIRYYSHRASPFFEDVNKSAQPNVRVEHNPPEWKYVEAILPPLIVPKPSVKSDYSSGWKPQTIDPKSTPYFIKRSSNHQVPVYLRITFRGTRRQTIIKNIQGDIWVFEADLRAFLEDYMKKNMSIRINEFTGRLLILGDYVNLVKHFLAEKGF